MMDWSERGNSRKTGPSLELFRKNSLQLTGEPVMVQRKKKPSGAQRKHPRKVNEAPYNSQRPHEVFNILTEVFIVPWKEIQGALLGFTPGSVNEDQLRLGRQKKVGFITFLKKCMVVQVKL